MANAISYEAKKNSKDLTKFFEKKEEED